MMNTRERTAWAIICPIHGQVFYTYEEYMNELSHSDYFWKCPICRYIGVFDDDNYERYLEEKVEELRKQERQ